VQVDDCNAGACSVGALKTDVLRLTANSGYATDAVRRATMQSLNERLSFYDV